LQELKNHIRHTSASNANLNLPVQRHMLMVTDIPHSEDPRRHTPATLQYICPNDSCTETFPDNQSWQYLCHVLHCQGHILDAQESSARAVAAVALKKADVVAGFINCPVSNCYFVTPSHQQVCLLVWLFGCLFVCLLVCLFGFAFFWLCRFHFSLCSFTLLHRYHVVKSFFT
jgi:hypothetical protein